MLTSAQVIEAFHLTFLEVLRQHVKPECYVLKGGANLRYFFGSLRYSEDIDLDIDKSVEVWKLREQIDTALASPALALTLRSSGLAIDSVNVKKQTDDTRRWMVHLDAPGHEGIHTRIEFSGRNGETRHTFEAVPADVVKPYGMRAPTVRHYLITPAIKQKVLVLAQRSLTQARDVFDLDLLLHKEDLPRGELTADKRKLAADQASALTYQAFETMVLPFLHPDVASLYDEVAWAQMQTFVIEELLKEID
jgi:predicted nucleotidyltransferase component of viral defense system